MEYIDKIKSSSFSAGITNTRQLVLDFGFVLSRYTATNIQNIKTESAILKEYSLPRSSENASTAFAYLQGGYSAGYSYKWAEY